MSFYEGMFAGATVRRTRFAKVGTRLPTGVHDHLPPEDWKVTFPEPAAPLDIVVDLMQDDPALRYGHAFRSLRAAVVVDLAMPDGRLMRIALPEVELRRGGEGGQLVSLMSDRPFPLLAAGGQ